MEVIVISLVVAVTAAVAIPNLIAMDQRAKNGITTDNAGILQDAAEQYRNDHGVYPTFVLPLIHRLPGHRPFKNAFDGEHVEPRYGRTPGSIVYFGLADGSNYTILCIGAKGDTLLKLTRLRPYIIGS